eukprot:scpid112062/ scgid7818/ 
MPPGLEDVENRISAFSAYGKRVSTVKPSPQIEKDSLTLATTSITGVSVGRMLEMWEQHDALAMPVERRRHIEQNSASSKVVAQNQDLHKHSKSKTSQRCQ